MQKYLPQHSMVFLCFCYKNSESKQKYHQLNIFYNKATTFCFDNTFAQAAS